MCLRCPARRTCAEDAVVQGAQTGMYAGVWVPQQSDRRNWARAMDRLKRIGGISEPTSEDTVQVSA